MSQSPQLREHRVTEACGLFWVSAHICVWYFNCYNSIAFVTVLITQETISQYGLNIWVLCILKILLFKLSTGRKNELAYFFLMLTRCLKSSHKRGVREQAHWVPNPARGCSPTGLPHRALFLIIRGYVVFQERADEEMLSRILDGVTEKQWKRASPWLCVLTR